MSIKVRMLSTVAGPFGVLNAGEVHELEKERALSFIEAHAAVSLEPIKQVEVVEEADARKRKVKSEKDAE
jgi:hypothetical protein